MSPALWLTVAAAVSLPAPGEVLTVERAVELALQNHPESRAVMEDLAAERGRWVQAGLLPNPDVELGLRAPGGAQPPQLDLGLELNLTAAVLAPVRSGVAEAGYEAERLRVAGQLLELGWAARVAFFEVQAATARLQLRERFLESQRASYATALELEKVGNLPPLAVAAELSQVEHARAQVADAEAELLDAREALNRALGLWGHDVQWEVDGALGAVEDVTSPDDAEARVVRASLELQALERRIEAARRTVTLTRAEGWAPTVVGGFHGERDGALWELGGHVTVSLPIFDRAQGRTATAERELKALELRREGAAIAVRSAVRATLNRLESSARRARHFQQRVVPARQRQLEQTLLEYNAMGLGVFEVLQAERSVTESALEQIDVTLEYWKARAAWELALAGRTPNPKEQP